MRQTILLKAFFLSLLCTSLAWAQGSVPQELCGRWTYFSGGSTYTGGGYSVERYVVLNPDGTYEYGGESSNSGGNGSAYGSSVDQGRWWIEGETLCGQSSTTGQTVQYSIELYNNKNGDPMIVIDGDAYVTATQRDPWPW